MQTSFFKKYDLPLFFVVSFLIPWLIWVPMALEKFGIIKLGLSTQSPLMLIGVMTPALTAVLILVVVRQKGAVKKLFSTLGEWKVPVRWYLFILLYPVSAWLLGRGIDLFLGINYASYTSVTAVSVGDSKAMLIPLFFFLIFTTLGEEIGWRGFALPRLQKKFSSLTSSIILGIFWGVWHLPIFLANGQDGPAIIIQLISVIAYTVIMTWVFNNTRGSLLIAWIFHWVMAATSILLPPLPTITDDLIHWIFALLLIIIAGPLHISRKNEKITIDTYGVEINE